MIGDILQPTHLLLILVVALIVLGPKRLPEVGKSLGRGLRDFRSALSGEDHEPHGESLHQAAVAAPAPAQTAPHPQAEAPAEPAPAPPVEAEPVATPPLDAEPVEAPPVEPEHVEAEHVGAEPVEQPQPVSTGAQSEPNERSE